MMCVTMQTEGTSKLFMWLPDYGEVVRVSPAAQRSGALTRTFRDWAGNRVTPEDGERFLEATFDYFTVQGLKLQWVNLGRCGLEELDILGIES
jgi:hypothetical protein